MPAFQLVRCGDLILAEGNFHGPGLATKSGEQLFLESRLQISANNFLVQLRAELGKGSHHLVMVDNKLVLRVSVCYLQLEQPSILRARLRVLLTWRLALAGLTRFHEPCLGVLADWR